MLGGGCCARLRCQVESSFFFPITRRHCRVLRGHRGQLRRLESREITVKGVARKPRDLKSDRALCKDRLTLGDQSCYSQPHIIDLQSLTDVLVAAGAAVQVTERGPQVIRHISPGLPSVPRTARFHSRAADSRCRPAILAW